MKEEAAITVYTGDGELYKKSYQQNQLLIDMNDFNQAPYILVSIENEENEAFFYDKQELKIKTGQPGVPLKKEELNINKETLLGLEGKVLNCVSTNQVLTLAKDYVRLNCANKTKKDEMILCFNLNLTETNDYSLWSNVIHCEHEGKESLLSQLKEIIAEKYDHPEIGVLTDPGVITVSPDFNVELDQGELQLITRILESDDPWEPSIDVEVNSAEPEESVTFPEVPKKEEDPAAVAATPGATASTSPPVQLEIPPQPTLLDKIKAGLLWVGETFGLILLYLMISLLFAGISGSFIPLVTNLGFPVLVIVLVLSLRISQTWGNGSDSL